MERWQVYLGGWQGWMRVREGENDRKGLQGVKRQEERRRRRKVTGRKSSRWEDYRRSEGKVEEKGRVWGGWWEQERNAPAPAVARFTSCDLCSSPSYQVCLCVYVCVGEQWWSIRQEVKASQDACPIVALVVSRRCSARRPLPEWRASEATFPPGRLSVSVISSNWRQEEDSERNRELLFIEQTGCLQSLFLFIFSGTSSKQTMMSISTCWDGASTT